MIISSVNLLRDFVKYVRDEKFTKIDRLILAVLSGSQLGISLGVFLRSYEVALTFTEQN